MFSTPPTKVGGLDRCRVTPVKMGAPPLRQDEEDRDDDHHHLYDHHHHQCTNGDNHGDNNDNEDDPIKFGVWLSKKLRCAWFVGKHAQ